MFLAVDIGNSNIKFGIYSGDNLLTKFSITTNRESSVEDLKIAVGSNLDFPISDVFVCSVVPELHDAFSDFVTEEMNCRAVFVTNDFDFGMTVRYEPLSAVGTDRLVNSFSAAESYGVPCIVCSFGTALTIDVVDQDRVLLGGLIAPGMAAISRALHLSTSKLPEVSIEKPTTTIQNTTVGSLQSGIVFGYIGLAKELLSRIKNEVRDEPKVIATGGFAAMIAEDAAEIDVVDENLLLDGLRVLFERRS